MKAVVTYLLCLGVTALMGAAIMQAQCETGVTSMQAYYPYGGSVTQGQTIWHYWYIPTTVSTSTISIQWSSDKVNWTTVASGYPCTSGYYSYYITAPWDFPPTTTCYARMVEVTSGKASCYYYPGYTYSYNYNYPFAVVRGCQYPPITQQPKSQITCVGAKLTLTVGAPTGSYYTYKWFKDGKQVSTSGPNLDIASVTLGDAGKYKLQVNDVCGLSTTTSEAVVTVYDIPVMVQEPINTTICKGTGGSIFATCTGSTNLYQWYKNGVKIQGATTSSLSFINALPTDVGTYYLTVTSGCGSPLTSKVVTLTVPPKADITQQPVGGAICPGSNFTMNVATVGSGTTYKWYHNDQVILGASTPAYTIVNATKADDGYYQCFVDIPGILSATGCNPLVMSDKVFVYTYAAPVINKQPVGANLCVGSKTQLTVGADGTGLTYQWYHDGTLIPGATNFSLPITAGSAAQAGSYSVSIGGVCGYSATSEAVDVRVYNQPMIQVQPQSTSVMMGQPITLSVQATDVQSITWLHNEQPIANVTSSTLSIPNATSADNGYYRALVKNVCGGLSSRLARVTVIDPASLEPHLSSSPMALDEDEVPMGYSGSRTFTNVVTNIGNVPVTISQFTMTGTDADAFTLESTSMPMVLQPGEGATVKIVFVPSQLGDATATLSVVSDATEGPNEVPVVGTGVIRYTVDGDLAFGTVDKMSANTKCFQINNTSTMDIVIDNVELSGETSAAFSLSSAVPLSIAAGSTKELCLQFNPNDVGMYSAAVGFKSSTGGDLASATSGTSEIAASVAKDATEAGINAYPNPASMTLAVNTGSILPTSVQVLTTTGQVVAKLPAERAFTWDLSSRSGSPLPSGVYILLVADQQATYRMMLQIVR